MCQDGAFVIDSVSFYPSKALGTELTAEADWKRRGLYIGPQFDTLDVGVQEELERFLQERGINESLALFVPEFAEYKEQKVCIPGEAGLCRADCACRSTCSGSRTSSRSSTSRRARSDDDDDDDDTAAVVICVTPPRSRV
jgi:hypothetical protein